MDEKCGNFGAVFFFISMQIYTPIFNSALVYIFLILHLMIMRFKSYFFSELFLIDNADPDFKT